MRLLDVRWARRCNEIQVGCGCGEKFWQRIDRWQVKCPYCRRTAHIDSVRMQRLPAVSS